MCSDNKTLLISSHIFYMRKSLKLHAIIIYLGYKVHEKIIYTSQHIFYIMWPILIEHLNMKIFDFVLNVITIYCYTEWRRNNLAYILHNMIYINTLM